MRGLLGELFQAKGTAQVKAHAHTSLEIADRITEFE